MFAQAEVEVTEDPERLLVSMVRYQPGTSERQVSSFLEAVWITELRLPGVDAFHFTTGDRYVELESITGDQESGYFLSLNLIAVEGGAQDFIGPATGPTQPPVEADAPRTRKRFWKTSAPATNDKD